MIKTMEQLKFQTLKGFRDFLPQEALTLEKETVNILIIKPPALVY